jgi:hypothetical protein
VNESDGWGRGACGTKNGVELLLMVTNAKHLFDGSRGCGPSNIGNCFKFDD